MSVEFIRAQHPQRKGVAHSFDHSRENYEQHDLLADMCLQRDCATIASLGGRALYEFVAEIGRERGLRTYLEEKASRFARIDAAALRVTGGDTFPPRPLHRVGGAQ